MAFVAIQYVHDCYSGVVLVTPSPLQPKWDLTPGLRPFAREKGSRRSCPFVYRTGSLPDWRFDESMLQDSICGSGFHFRFFEPSGGLDTMRIVEEEPRLVWGFLPCGVIMHVDNQRVVRSGARRCA